MPENTRPERADDHLYNDFSRLNNELANAQRELAKKNAELDRLNQQKNQFLGIAAHDLRNPLEIILRYSQFLMEDTQDIFDEEQMDFIKTIRSSSRFMLDLVNDFLDYSKIEAGKLELDLEPVDFLELIRENVKRNRVLAEQKQIEIVFAPEEIPTLTLMLDESKIEQVLNNLIGNAIKFSPFNGKIEVCMYVRKSDDGNGAEKLIVMIKDQGAGVSPEELKKIFNPFERGANRSTGGEKNTGLGLAIVKKIIEGHKGTVSIESIVGEGTIVSVSIPIIIEKAGKSSKGYE